MPCLMAAARNHEIDCVLVWKFDRFARSTRHLLAALEEFNHLARLIRCRRAVEAAV
jgi:DNA invertase Pin-like site-specific DNA recombinase